MSIKQDKLRVYLCGPISGLSYTQATRWREQVKAALKGWCIILDPMRGKSILKSEERLGVSYEFLSPLLSAEFIDCRDYLDIRRCDVVLAYLDEAEWNSIGSLLEIGAAIALGKPVVLVDSRDNSIKYHPLLIRRVLPADNLEVAVDFVKGLCGVE